MPEKRSFLARFGKQTYEFHTLAKSEEQVAQDQTGYGNRTVKEQLQHLEDKFTEIGYPFRMVLKHASKDPSIMEDIFKREPGLYLNLTMYQRLSAVKDKSANLKDVEGLDYLY